mmetsp:Transcript_24920/g.29983  ORF Transcript_24920/g.29983 Transcript_24920/m.29983 type:complete len:1144 (-) Transcript_24920:316-3747(-)
MNLGRMLVLRRQVVQITLSSQKRMLRSSPVRRELVKVEVPSMGDSITEATIVSLSHTVGDGVAADEVVAVLETDKVAVEVHAPKAGVLKQYFVQIDDTVSVGQEICIVDTEGVASAPEKKESVAPASPPPESKAPASAPPESKALPPPESKASTKTQGPALSGTSSLYADAMYENWLRDPSSVHASWAAYFSTGDYLTPPENGTSLALSSSTSSLQGSSGADTLRALHLIAAYQRRGHERADIDPLKLKQLEPLEDLDPVTYGFDMSAETDRPLLLEASSGSTVAGLMGSADVNQDGATTLRELVNFLQETYCGTLGIETEHITDLRKLNWLRSRIEVPRPEISKEERMHILERLAYSEKFEQVLATKFNTAKRFGLEGCESMIPGMKTMVDHATLLGVQDIIIGMPHRGRLNVLCNVVRKPVEVIFREFLGTQHIHALKLGGEAKHEEDWSSSGDVKYHLGTSFERAYPDGRRVQIEVLPNPSHLEAVDPLVVGKARARMDMKNDNQGKTVLPVLIHGDAAFAGQGIVYETLQMYNLDAYQCGGTIHVICNNQVGFTAIPEQGRSTMYASDLGKAFDAPIFHVNADDPENVCRVFQLAVAWRQEFHTDVVIDLIGYRKYGHNEIDEPTFTQPKMYQKIKTHPTALEIYLDVCTSTNPYISKDEANSVINDAVSTFSKAYDARDECDWDRDIWGQHWNDIKPPHQVGRGAYGKTGIDRSMFELVGKALSNVPSDFTLHRRLKGRFNQFASCIESGEEINWALAEQLALGTLLMEGIPVRFTGQDVERGTFTHRHAVVHDQNNGKTHTFLNAIHPAQEAQLYIKNSFLSEYGCLGFELGYSLETPNVLIIWEAQFGDFVNGAQIIIDQFLSSGEAKWMRQSGLVLLLPHGYQGQGPEHSSCRIERFLQNSDEDPDVIPANLDTVEGQTRQVQLNNWQIINPTTPANYFHALRRQQHREFRKPLIVASTKALLRHKLAISSFTDIQTGSRFRRTYGEMYPNEVKPDNSIRRLVLCSGKIYYELLEARRQKFPNNDADVAIARIEQISPFPFDQVANYAKQYPNAQLVWCQEEPKNMGCWYFVRDRIMTATRVYNTKEQRPGYCGRTTMASTAEGYGPVHDAEQAKIVDTALGSDVTAIPFGADAH